MVNDDLKQWIRLCESEDEIAQNQFDDQIERIRAEGREAFAAGILKTASPYKEHVQPHFNNAWIGGWAEAKLDSLFNT